jgi:hypothetical protein
MKGQEVGDSCIMRSFITCILHLNDQAKKDEMGKACSTIAEKRDTCRLLVEDPEGKRPPRHKCVGLLRLLIER